MIKLITTFLLTLFIFSLPAYSVVINEMIAANNSINSDADGDFSDWLELFNETEQTVQLQGYYLSDDSDEMQKWKLPTVTLAPHSFLLIWCSGKDKIQGELHTNFRLNRDGEQIVLSTPGKAVVDSFTFPPLPTDVSYGRRPDGTAEFVIFQTPTPNAPNNTDANQVAAAVPLFSKSAGFYPGAFVLEITTATLGAEIRYTFDASEPTRTSFRYDQKIRIDSTGIIRAVAFKSGMNPSPIATHSFFVGAKSGLNDLPVLSLVTDPDNLWDSTIGIYANPLETGAEWERPVSVEFFEPPGTVGFSTEAGIRIHGGASRFPHKSAKKSFRLYFRAEYGMNRLDYPIIPSTENTRFDRLVLRAGFNDAWIHWLAAERELTTYVRDPLVRDVFLELGQPASAGDFVHLFLNGAYWGLYNISERYDDDFCDTYIERGDWDVVKPGPDENHNAIEAAEGDLVEWHRFYNWFKNRDFAGGSNYEVFKTWVDIDNFVDFYILNIFSQNYDWPRHNWYAVRKRDGGRWIFLPWDSEYAFGSGNRGYNHSINMWDAIENQVNYPLPLLLSKLKRNDRFREEVAARFSGLFSAQLSQANLLKLLEERLDQIRSAIPFEAERWGSVRPPDVYDFSDWLAAAESMKRFIRNREPVLRGQLVGEGFVTPAGELPENWHQRDVGNVQTKGFASYNNGIFTVAGSGADIWNTEDEFYYVWMTSPGDVDIQARVTSITNTNAWAKAGVMIRESTYSTTKNAYVALTPDKVTFQRRQQNGGATVSTKVENITAPHWIRLQRTGDRFTGYHSKDGVNWTKVGFVTISMRQNALAGLAVTSHNDGLLCTATFDNVLVNGLEVFASDKVESPVDFALLQNYPNPFNAVTTIKFCLPELAYVNLSIINIAGELVDTIGKGFFQRGHHQMNWEAAHLSTGTYFIKLQANKYVGIKKCVLLK